MTSRHWTPTFNAALGFWTLTANLPYGGGCTVLTRHGQTILWETEERAAEKARELNGDDND